MHPGHGPEVGDPDRPRVLWIPREVRGRKIIQDLDGQVQDRDPKQTLKFRVVHPNGVFARRSAELKIQSADASMYLPKNTIIVDGKAQGCKWVSCTTTILPPSSKIPEEQKDWVVITDDRNSPCENHQSKEANKRGKPRSQKSTSSHSRDTSVHRRSRTQQLLSPREPQDFFSASSSSTSNPSETRALSDGGVRNWAWLDPDPGPGKMLPYQDTKGLIDRISQDYHTVKWRASLARQSLTDPTSVQSLVGKMRNERKAYLQACALNANLLTSYRRVRRSSTSGAQNNLDKLADGLDQSTLTTILADVDRTYQRMMLFRSEETKQLMNRILIIWTISNPDIGYRQSVSQILAIIYIAYHKDLQSQHLKTQNGAIDFQKYPEGIEDMVDADNIEPDAYGLLNLFMRGLYRNFGGREAGYEAKKGGGESETDTAGVERVMDLVHHRLLKSFDNEVYQCLQRENVIPQLYLVRWIRLLFAREFRIDQVLCLWDNLTEDLGMIKYLCVTLVIVMRSKLLSAEAEGNLLQFLLRPGSFVLWDANMLCRHARSLKEGRRWFTVAPSPPQFAMPNSRFASGIWNRAISKRTYRRLSGQPKLRASENKSRTKRSNMGGFPKVHKNPQNKLLTLKSHPTSATPSLSGSKSKADNFEEDVSECEIDIGSEESGNKLTLHRRPTIDLSGEESGERSVLPEIAREMSLHKAVNPHHMNVQGLLVKRGEIRRNYKLRWFVLKGYILSYYKREEDWTQQKSPLRSVDIRSFSVRTLDQKRYYFALVPPRITGRRYDLYASDAQAMQFWVSALTSAISHMGNDEAVHANGYGTLDKISRSTSRHGSFAVEAPF